MKKLPLATASRKHAKAVWLSLMQQATLLFATIMLIYS